MSEGDDHEGLPLAQICSFATPEDGDDFFLVLESVSGERMKVIFPREYAQFLVRVIQDHMGRIGQMTEYPREVRAYTIGPEFDSESILLRLDTVDNKSFAFSFDQTTGVFGAIVELMKQMHGGMPPSGSAH